MERRLPAGTLLALLEQFYEIDSGGIGARDIRGHDQGMIGEDPEAIAGENHRAHQRVLGAFQFA